VSNGGAQAMRPYPLGSGEYIILQTACTSSPISINLEAMLHRYF
jgi:hypothetical protein